MKKYEAANAYVTQAKQTIAGLTQLGIDSNIAALGSVVFDEAGNVVARFLRSPDDANTFIQADGRQFAASDTILREHAVMKAALERVAAFPDVDGGNAEYNAGYFLCLDAVHSIAREVLASLENQEGTTT